MIPEVMLGRDSTRGGAGGQCPEASLFGGGGTFGEKKV